MDDEFDAIPDLFAGDDLDWAQLLGPQSQSSSLQLSLPSTSASTTSVASTSSIPTPHYGALSHPFPIQPTLLSSPRQPLFMPPLLNSELGSGKRRQRNSSESSSAGILTPSRKRNRTTPPQSGSRKKKKSSDTLRHALTVLEEELTCSICYDIFVATHLLSPCGHSFCGDCGWQWVVKNRKPGCPVCRTPLPSRPMVPNLGMDKVVESHIGLLRQNADADWGEGGKKLADFQGPSEVSLCGSCESMVIVGRKWKDGAAQRTRSGEAIAWVLMSVSDDEESDGEWDSDED
ncbi:hypothetical protein C8J57DRAFT_20026 [Mycena rebaudengoi]|nr:hypothetical protein C8J57DRAFT_20026 [Mycena rebaudengoi]